MPTNEELLKLGQIVVSELDHFGSTAPFVGYVNVLPQDGMEHVFVARGDHHPSTEPSSSSVQYVRYREPLGKLAEARPGQIAHVSVEERVGRNTRTGHFFVTKYQVQSKDVFRVSTEGEYPDAVQNQVAFADGAVFIPALRGWLSLTKEEIAKEIAKPRRRRIADRFELADIPIVDSAQGDIWRLPIRKFIVITGAPGTGKTTTAIKRIALLTDPNALANSNGAAGASIDDLQNWLRGRTNWVLFTPSELLRGYLREALAQEGLAATEDQVPVWSTTKIRIARDVLPFTGQGRFFSLGQDLVAGVESKKLSEWSRGFLSRFNERVFDELGRAVAEQSQILSEVLLKATEKCAALRQQIEPARVSVRALEDQLSKATSEQERDALRSRIQEAEVGTTPIEESFDALDKATSVWNELAALAGNTGSFQLGRALASLSATREKLNQFLARVPENRWHQTDAVIIKPVAAATKSVLSKFVDETIDPTLRKIPAVYQQYRLAASEDGHFFHSTAMGAVNDRRLDPLEIDALIYVALHTVRESFTETDFVQRSGSSITQRLINEFRYIVAVDEATDFSAVELACMRLLAHPVFDCVTFAGDPMQRMTSHGISDWPEVAELLADAPESKSLTLSYRQSRKLLTIAAQLYEKSIGKPAPFSAGYGENANDPDALRFQANSRAEQAQWIAARIGEIYKICGEVLPSIAVLVPEESDVRPVADLLREPIREAYSIETEECLEGRILGTQAKVRVFSVQFIKGLEFEAVFFVGADHMAKRASGFVERFLYVGLTRARSFLAVTTDGQFPKELAHVVNHFKESTWEHLVPPPEEEQS